MVLNSTIVETTNVKIKNKAYEKDNNIIAHVAYHGASTD